MKTNLLTSFLAACTLAALPASADHGGGGVKRNTRSTLSVTLSPTVDAPAGALGSAEVRIRQKDDEQRAKVKLTVTGLVTGDYTLNATLKDASTAVIGAFHVAASGKPAEWGKDDGTICLKVPEAVDATQIASLNVADANAVVLLVGDTTLDTIFVKFFANVPVTGPVVTTSRHDGHSGKRVHGHALAQSTIEDGVETKRHFLWVAHNAPANTELTINVDGVAVGTVTSTKQGKVMFKSLDESVDLASMKLITLTDALSAVVMQAEF